MNELLRLARENNRMLKGMRRNAFWGGVFRLVMWIAFIIIPLWLYMQYVAPMMTQMLATYEQIQGANASAQAQFGQMSQYLDQLKSLYGGGSTQ